MRPLRVLIVFNTPYLYGMERSVIETFDAARPRLRPHFLLSLATARRRLPVLAEIERRGLEHSFFSDRRDWPGFGRPRTLVEGVGLALALLKGNRDVLRAARGHDAIYLPSANYLWYAAAAAAWFRAGGRRVVYEFHDLVPTPSARLRLATALVTDFVHHTAYGLGVVTTANPCVLRRRNTVAFPAVEMRGAAEEAGRPAPGSRRIVFVGQVGLHKGIDLLLEAFAALAPGHPDLTLDVVGDCADEGLDRWLAGRVSGPALAGRVVRWGFLDAPARVVDGAYVAVCPSPPSRFHEALGRTAVEAMGLGVPVVCFRSGALPEIVAHEETGLVCGEETAGALARAIARFLDEPAFRDACGRRAREVWKARFAGPAGAAARSAVIAGEAAGR